MWGWIVASDEAALQRWDIHGGAPGQGFLKDFGNSDGEQGILERSRTRNMVF